MPILFAILANKIDLSLVTTILGNVYERKAVAFVLDCSKSISTGAFERSIGFLQNLVDFVSISTGTTRVALITFATKFLISLKTGRLSLPLFGFGPMSISDLF